MKKIILACGAAVLALASCNQEKIEQQKKTIESLKEVVAKRDTSMSLIATTLADVHSNLNYIKEKEGIIAVQANSETSDKDQLSNDIQSIYAKLVDNKNKVKELQAKLNKTLGKNKEYKQIIEVLNQQIEQQNAEIAKLNKMLDDKNVEIGFLNNAIISLSTSVDSLATVSAETQETLAQTIAEKNEGYYLVAEKSMLKEKGLLSGGLFNKKVLAGDIDNSLFTKVDVTEVESIPLTGRKFVVLTPQPESSYSIDEEKKVLVIKDKEAFWKATRYLVVRAKDVDEE